MPQLKAGEIGTAHAETNHPFTETVPKIQPSTSVIAMRWKNVITTVTIIFTALGSRTMGADASFKSGLYQITSGLYMECCGIAGSVTVELPTSSRALVELTVDPSTGQARFDIRDQGAQSVALSVSNGIISSDSIVFGAPFEMADPNETKLYFKIQLSTSTPGGISLEGHLVTPQEGADMIHDFRYRSVEAGRVSHRALEIRVSELEVCWSAEKGQRYQPQYRSAVEGATWFNLGLPVNATETRHCITDKPSPNDPQRLYRILLLPSQVEETSPPAERR